MIDNLSISVHVFSMRKLTSLLVDEILLLRYMKCSTNFRILRLKVELTLSCLRHVLFAFTLRPMFLAACFRLRCRDLAWRSNLIPDIDGKWSEYYWHTVSLKETIIAIIMVYKNIKAMVNKLDSDWYGRWSLTRRYISIISVYDLSRLCTINVSRSNKRKWFQFKEKE